MPTDGDLERRLQEAKTLGAIDERTKNIERSLSDSSARIEKRLDEMSATFVTKAAFTPVRMIAFGLVALAMTAVILAMLAQVLNSAAGG